jgi:rhodanese-related sulfurtransferase
MMGGDVKLLNDTDVAALIKRFNKHPDQYVIIDVRDRDEYDAEHIAGSCNIPRNELEQWQFSENDKHKIAVMHCKSGRRTAFPETIEGILSRNFKETYSMEGGIDQWKRLGGELARKIVPKKAGMFFLRNKCLTRVDKNPASFDAQTPRIA